MGHGHPISIPRYLVPSSLHSEGVLAASTIPLGSHWRTNACGATVRASTTFGTDENDFQECTPDQYSYCQKLLLCASLEATCRERLQM